LNSRIGDMLIHAGKLQKAQLERALRVQKDSAQHLGNLLVQLGFVAERDLVPVLAEQLGVTLATAEQYQDTPDLSDRISRDFLRHNHALPVAEDDNRLTVAMSDPRHGYLLQALELAAGKPVTPLLGARADILAALEKQSAESTASHVMDSPATSPPEAITDDVEHLKDMASEAPVIRAVNHLIVRALEQRASDIHFEPTENGLIARYRIDGVLREVDTPAAPAAALVSRIKVMAELNIAERRLPQDGRIKLRMEGRSVDMRISTLPTLYGESVVMRLLDQGNVALDFEALGFTGDNQLRLQRLLSHPQGIILVTGPTGSGKTTTLYAALQQLNTPEKKILTVEDPIEYQLDGINQIQVQPKIDLTFASALRSILRQDPDIIMVGEMRDSETARIAVQAALTGHKVLSTLHTNDAPSSITRMLDMRVDDFLLTSTVDGILAQRLVRRLCRHCREPYTPSPAVVRQYQLDQLPGNSSPSTLYHPGGCEHCEQSGYQGRTTIVELLIMSEAIRKVIIQGGDADRLRRVARAEGMLSLHEDGLRKALLGLTTLEEVERVTQADVGCSGP